MKNISLFDYEPVKKTSRARFFEEIEPHLPLDEWMSMIAPIYHVETKYGGRPPKPLDIMLRTLLVQDFYSLSDEACEDALWDIISVRKFVGITAANESDIPDKSTICRFRNLLIQNGIQQKIFNQVVSSLTTKGLIMKKGSIVDSSIVESSTSKRNKDKACDPDSAWTKKAGNYKHGYKSHIAVDSDSGLVTSNQTTPANVHDVNIGNNLLSGEEEAVYGDSGYLGLENHRNALSSKKYRIMQRPSQIDKLPENQQEQAKQRQHAIASVRAKVEHVFATIKRLFGWRRTRYRGLEKNAAKLNMLLALSNLWKASRISKTA